MLTQLHPQMSLVRFPVPLAGREAWQETHCTILQGEQRWCPGSVG